MIKKLCLTGGPCGGKTTAMSYLSQKLSDRGFYPLFVPEAATLLINGGISPREWGAQGFQTRVIQTILGLEASFMEAARLRPDLNPVIICDRGLADSLAYAPEDIYLGALRSQGISSHVAARDEHYDAVFHLVTAALGAESFYTLATNAARLETPEEAVALDRKTLAAWTGAPHLRAIDNSTDFAGKLERLDREVCAALGVPVPLEIERKFVCAPVMLGSLPPDAQRITIEQAYLMSNKPSVEMRIRKRGQHGNFTYYFTEKQHVGVGQRLETERLITQAEYELRLAFKKPKTRVLHKQRICFMWEHQYFELDIVRQEDGTELYLLEIELTDLAQSVSIPPFVHIEHDVTDDITYSNAHLAKVA